MRYLVVGVVLVVAALGATGWRYVTGGFPFAPPPVALAPEKPRHVVTDAELAAARRAIADRLNKTPEFVPFFTRLRDNFPNDYRHITDMLVQRAATGDLNEGVDSDLSEAYRQIRQTRGVLAARAGTEALDKVLATQAAVLTALGHTDAHLCVDFLYGGASAPYFEFSETHRTLIGAMATANIDAIIEGTAAKDGHPKPSDGDFQVFETALRQRGLSADEIGALLDGKPMNPPIKDDRLCVAGQIRLQALKSLDPDQRQRLFALMLEMMARS